MFMIGLVKLELKKIFSKKDIMIISSILILSPLVFGICMVNRIAGLNFNGQITVDAYGIMIWSFLKYLFVLYLMPIYLVCCFVGKEIESRSINIMLSNYDRKKVFAAKMTTYLITITIFFVLFHIVSMLTFSGLIHNTEFALAGSGNTLTKNFFLYLFQWLELLFVAIISYLLCCAIKGNAVLVLGIGVIILQKIVVNIEGVRRFLPFYISDFNYYSMIPDGVLMNTNIISCIIYTITIMATFCIALKMWSRKDF